MTEVYILSASGDSAVFSGRFQAISRCAYETRELAEADIARFRQSCCDPSQGLNYAEDNDRLGITVRPMPLMRAGGADALHEAQAEIERLRRGLTSLIQEWSRGQSPRELYGAHVRELEDLLNPPKRNQKPEVP